jgi:predicted nucleic acid-binding protein
LILVDSSVWIDFFSSAPGPGGRELRRLIAESEPIGLSGLMVTEVLQGLARDVERIEKFLRLWELVEPGGFESYRNTARLFRLARSKGVTLTTVDALIATIALEHAASVFTLDKDFGAIAELTGLRIHRSG